MIFDGLPGTAKAAGWRPVRMARQTPLAAACLLVCAAARAATFNVNSAADVPDATPGDGKCETAAGNAVCTLRAAVQEANALPGHDVINLQANVTYLLTRVGIEDAAAAGSLDISDSLDIVGAGPASSIVDGNGEVTNDRVFQLLPCIGNDATCSLGKAVAHLSGMTIRHGKTPDRGGGVFAAVSQGHTSSATVTNCRIEDNDGGLLGGGIYDFGSLALNGSVVAGNTAANGGGAILGGPFTIEDSTFSGNTASETGGGIRVVGFGGSINRSTISGNHAAQGGGVFTSTSSYGSSGQLVITNSTISGNSTRINGGGIKVYAGVTYLFNVTIAGNVTNTDHSGADGAGGGVVNNSLLGTLNFTNSIIANNSSFTDSQFTVLTDCSGTLTSQGFNIVRYLTACTILGSYATDAVLLGALQNNGGPTMTHALLAGSAGIDAGNPAGCTDSLGAILATDQRGRPRTVGARCDLGAYEVPPDQIFKNGFDPV